MRPAIVEDAVNPSVSLPRTQWERVKVLARKNQRSASAEVRIAVERHLEIAAETAAQKAAAE